MTIEKLQKIVTCHVEPSFKAKWLHLWNAPLQERSDNKFPIDKPLREKILDDWLHKASFWAQVHTPPPPPFLSLFFYSACSVSNHLTLRSWRRRSPLKLIPFKRTSASTLIGMHPRLSCALVSMLIIGGLSFGIEPSSLISAITRTSPLPKVITSRSLRRGHSLSSALHIGNASILLLCTSPSSRFLLQHMVFLFSSFVV